MNKEEEKTTTATVASFGPTKELSGVPEAAASSSSQAKGWTLEEAIAVYEGSGAIASEKDMAGGEYARVRLLRWVEMSRHQCKRRSSPKALAWAFGTGVVLGIAMMLYFFSCCATSAHSERRDASPVPIFEKEYGPGSVVYPMQKSPNKLRMILGKTCVPIDVGSESDNRELVDLHYSLAHHISAEHLAGVSSYRVGNPLCYLVLPTAGGKLVSMGNPSVLQINTDTTIPIHVPSSYCPERDPSHTVTRTLQLWVSYLDPTNNWQRVERMLDHREALPFQLEFAILNGLSECDGSDRGIDSLKQLMRASN